MKADIKEWDPEDPKKWDKRLAWTTVWISTFSLTFGFCAWYLVPSLAPHLNAVGFHLDAKPALLARGDGGPLSRHLAYLMDLLTAHNGYSQASLHVDHLAAHSAWVLDIRGNEPRASLRSVDAVRLPCWYWRRHLLRTHGVHQLLLPEEQARLCPRRTRRPVGLRHLACPIRNADRHHVFCIWDLGLSAA